jgi:hypothetical protein
LKDKPELVSGNNGAGIIMLAEKGADLEEARRLALSRLASA